MVDSETLWGLAFSIVGTILIIAAVWWAERDL